VAGHARVLADDDLAALGRQQARGGAGQPQREVDGHRRITDPAADSVGAEILSHWRKLPCCCSRMAQATATASQVAATSWARTMRAPCKVAMVASATEPASRSCTARPVSLASIDLRDKPASTGKPAAAMRDRPASRVRLCATVL